MAALAAPGCRRRPEDSFLTYFNGDHLVSVRHPASWRSEEGTGQGVWYRAFVSPSTGRDGKAAVTVTLLAGPTGGTLDQYAQSYLQGNTVASSGDASRQGATGKRWRLAAADRSRRLSLVLLQDAGHVWGLYTQADAGGFDAYKEVVEEMEKSLTLQRPQDYRRYEQARSGLAIRVPDSWRTGQTFSKGINYLHQWLGPAMSLEKNVLLSPSVTVTVEPAPPGGLDAYYSGVRQRLGDAYKVITEVSWRGGRVAVARIETPLAVTRAKRYFWTSGQRGYSLSCEAREDLFVRVTRWCDVIASTIEIDGQPLPSEAPAAVAASPTPAPPMMTR